MPPVLYDGLLPINSRNYQPGYLEYGIGATVLAVSVLTMLILCSCGGQKNDAKVNSRLSKRSASSKEKTGDMAKGPSVIVGTGKYLKGKKPDSDSQKSSDKKKGSAAAAKSSGKQIGLSPPAGMEDSKTPGTSVKSFVKSKVTKSVNTKSAKTAGKSTVGGPGAAKESTKKQTETAAPAVPEPPKKKFVVATTVRAPAKPQKKAKPNKSPTPAKKAAPVPSVRGKAQPKQVAKTPVLQPTELLTVRPGLPNAEPANEAVNDPFADGGVTAAETIAGVESINGNLDVLPDDRKRAPKSAIGQSVMLSDFTYGFRKTAKAVSSRRM